MIGKHSLSGLWFGSDRMTWRTHPRAASTLIRVTIPQAKEIVNAVQAFGERRAPKKLEPPQKVKHETVMQKKT